MNNTIGWHIVFRAEDGRTLFPGPRERRIFARAVTSSADPRSLAAFDAAEEHGHASLLGPRPRAGCFARRAKNVLSRKLDLPCSFLKIEPSPIRDRVHAIRTIHYTFGQRARHGVTIDPLGEGSFLPDLLGYRILVRDPWEVIRSFNFKIAPDDLLRHLEGLELRPGTDLRLLSEALRSSIADIDGSRRDPLYLPATIAAVQVGYELGGTTAQIASALKFSRNRTRALRRLNVATPFKRAIRLQIGLREQVGIRIARA